MSLAKYFTDHPESVDETYIEHMNFAAGFGFQLILAGGAALVHAIFPWLCERTASAAVARLYHKTSGRNPDLS